MHNYHNFFLSLVRFYHTTQNYLKNILICKKRQLEQICLIEKDLVDPCKPSPKVIIVGAGLAGLSAASRLIKAGIKDVIVLEATERPGGRIHSCWLTNTIAEIGAEWIYGSSIANTTTTLAAQEGLLDPNSVYTPSDGTAPGAIYMTSEGRPINKALALKAYLTFKQIENRAYGLYELGCGREHGTLMNFFALAIEQELKNFPEHQRENAAKIMYAQTNTVSSTWGSDLDSVSADLLGSFTRMSGNTIGIPSGFVGILAPLIRDIPKASILYKKIVNNIQWSKVCDEDAKIAARVAVKCCDGTMYCGDYVVVTVSLGVLKAEASKMFTPSLPSEKLQAIKSLGFGNITKIFFEYQRPFWIWKEGLINLAWSMNELKSKDNWVTGISSIKELEGSQQILMATVGGKHAAKAEEISEQKVAEDVTSVLRKFTGDPSIPYPSSILRTRWKASPHFLGSNCYLAMKSTLGHQCDLSAPVPVTKADPNSNRPPPVPPIIFFAGEATSLNYFATVHGARVSGLRVAQEIIDLTRLYSGPPPLPGQLPKEFDPN